MEDVGPRRGRSVVRHGLIASLVLGTAALATALERPDAGDPPPYGVADCQTPTGDGPRVDVAVEARAQAPDGSPAPVLGASGVRVGASVRDLSGYAAEGVGPCDVVHVAVHLHDPALGGTVTGALEGPAGPVEVPGRSGRGSLVAEDWSTWAQDLPAGAPADAADRAAWFVTLTDPAEDEYVLHGRVAAATGASGDVEVVLRLTPSAA